MKALYQKELREYAAFLFLPAFLIFADASADDVGLRFVVPTLHEQLRHALIFPALAAAVLGFVQLVREEREETSSYLLHRELGGKQVLFAKGLAGMTFVAAVAWLPILASFASASLFSSLRHEVLPMRLVEELSLATAAFPAYGAGLFAATLRGKQDARAAAVFGAFLAVVFGCLGWMIFDPLPTGWDVAVLPLLCAAATAAFLRAAVAVPLGRAGVVRPVRAGAAWLCGALAVAATVPTFAFLGASASYVGSHAARGDVARYRVLLPSEGGHYEPHLETGPGAISIWAPPEDSIEDTAMALNSLADHGMIAALDVGGSGAPGDLERDTGGLGGRWVELPKPPSVPGSTRAWLDLDEGVVRRLWDGSAGDARMDVLVPESGPFGPQTVHVPAIDRGVHFEASELLLLDVEARDLLVAQLGEEPEVARVSLPGNDTLRSWAVTRPYAGRDGGSDTAWPNPSLALLGERGTYIWTADGIVPAPADLALASDPLPAGVADWRSDHDPLAPIHRAVDATGTVLYTHSHEPKPVRRYLAGLAYAGALMRSPLISARSFLSDPEPTRGVDLLVEPLFLGGRRAWLGLTHLGVCLALIALTVRRLGGRRAAAARVFGWGAAILLVGPAGYVAFLYVEPKRELPREASEAPRLLLLTKAEVV